MAKQVRQLAGKVAIVTGAAQGAGRATATALVREGVRVALGDIDRGKVEATAAEIGHGAIGLQLDVSDREAYVAFIDEVERRLGPLDIMINNAGIMPIGPFEDETPQTAERIVDVNLMGPLHGSKEAIRRFKARGTMGHIVNVASGAGWIPGAGGVTYSASKFAVAGLCEALSLELHGSGIDISVVAPAVIKTQLSEGITEVKGLRPVEPSEVGDAIVKGLKHNTYAIFVPPAMGAMVKVYSTLPYKVRGMMARATGSDKLLLNFDREARAAYEASVGARPTEQAPAAAETNIEEPVNAA
jgi:NAD(P)-dependent dehydrogenase (short-subunit alcohol dehydrogenase family)